MFNSQEEIDMNDRVQIAGIPINNLSYEEILGQINDLIIRNSQNYIVTVNPEMVLEANQNGDFFYILQKSAINTADGIGILWAAYFLSKPKYKSKILSFLQLFWSLILIFISPRTIKSVLRERITGTDLLPKVIDHSQNKGWTIFFLGADDGVAEAVINKFSKMYPNANFVGCFAGSPAKEDEQEICEKINLAKPDILFTAYGAPKQELWIHRNLQKLQSVKVAIGIGGAFDFHAGKIKRAPKLMQKVGLEWVWRLFRQPKRIRRIWNATYRFVKLIMKNKHSEVK